MDERIFQQGLPIPASSRVARKVGQAELKFPDLLQHQHGCRRIWLDRKSHPLKCVSTHSPLCE